MDQDIQTLLKVGSSVLRDAGVEYYRALPTGIMEMAHSAPDDRAVWAAPPIDPKALTILAHEAGHVATTPAMRDHHRPKTTEVEFEASRWGLQHIRSNGGKTTEQMEGFAREALNGYAEHDRQRYPKWTPSPEIAAFLAGDLDL